MTQINYPDCSLYEFVARRAEGWRSFAALEYYGRKISYARLLFETDRCAAALKALGVKRGDNVAVILPNIPQAVFVFYALNKLGAAASMIHPLSSRDEIARYIEITGSRIVIALDLAAEKAAVAAQTLIVTSVGEYMSAPMKAAYSLSAKKPRIQGTMTWRGLMALGKGKSVSSEGGADDAAAVLFSGGTTGAPKGIVLTNLNFNALALQSIDGCGVLEKGDRVLSVMPVFHGFGLGVCIHTVLCFGGTAIILPKFKASEFLNLVLKYKPNIVAGVPSIYEYMLRSNLKKRDLSFLKCAISGGDTLSAATKVRLAEMLSAHGCAAGVREGYGLTECVTGTCLSPAGDVREGCVGMPYNDTEYMIADPETGAELPRGEVGEIVLRGPTVMRGYLGDPEETARALRVHNGKVWLHTGDLGCMDDEGYVFFRQRLKRMIVSNGYNIYPQNLESVISSHSGVAQCAVVGVRDEIRGQRVAAFVVPKDGADRAALPKELDALCRERLSAYAVPRSYHLCDSLPKTLVGKIAYTELEKMGETADEQ